MLIGKISVDRQRILNKHRVIHELVSFRLDLCLGVGISIGKYGNHLPEITEMDNTNDNECAAKLGFSSLGGNHSSYTKYKLFCSKIIQSS